MHQEQRRLGWTAAQREARRLMAARLFRAGELAHAEIARTLGVSRAAVSQWHTAWQHGGDRRLTARPTGHPRSKLSAAQWRVLGRLLERGAVASGFDTEPWTLKRIAHVIERRFGVTYHYRYLERPLKAHGFTVQRPASRAKERDERLVAEWLRQTWPALKKKRRAARAARSPCGMRRATPSAFGCRQPGPDAAGRRWCGA